MTTANKATRLSVELLQEIAESSDPETVIREKWVLPVFGLEGVRAFDQLTDRQVRRIINRVTHEVDRLAESVSRLDKSLEDDLGDDSDNEAPSFASVTRQMMAKRT